MRHNMETHYLPDTLYKVKGVPHTLQKGADE